MYLLPIFAAFLVGLAPFAALLVAVETQVHRVPRRFALPFSSPAFLLLSLSLAFPLGAGLIGLASFVLLLLGVDSPWASLGLAAGVAGFAWLLLRSSGDGQTAGDASTVEPAASFPLNWVFGAVAALSLVAVFASMATILGKSPHGAWDSWAIWSLRGKFFAGGAEYWRNAVAPGFRLSHPEYPVMLSSYLGWSWRVAGATNPFVPQISAYAYLLSLVGTVGAGVGVLRRTSLGLMAIPILLSPVVMVTASASLYADLPMGALSAAAATVLLIGIHRGMDIRCFALAGVFASLCPWMKEEGLLHLLVFGVVAFAAAGFMPAEPSRRWRPMAAFAVSAAPASLFYAWFRYALVPGGSRFASAQAGGGGDGLVGRVLDLSRYGEIAEQLWQLFGTLGGWLAHPFLLLALPLLLLGICRGRSKNSAALAACATLALLWAGYLVSFLLMGGRPGPTLSASLHRIWVHTWPLLVVAILLIVNAPEDLAIRMPAKLSRSERREGKAARGRQRKGEA
ncbi:MAG: hypothetical protein IT169_04060 [Bryobacterales bacterium]|nr:hypothetical protein [Bryobacterales bacterium]